MEKIDPHKHKKKFENWKLKTANGIPDMSKENSDLIKAFIYDMEHGLNIATGSKKGARSYIRLNTLRDKMGFFAKTIKEKFKVDFIPDITEEQAHLLFNMMRNGTITRADGEPYQSVNYYVKGFKTFWHWYMKVNKKKLKAKVDALNKVYGENWFFVVTNEKFAPKYNQYGKTFTRETFLKQFEKWLKNT